jgi:folate-binding protein YgfZ
MSKTKLASLSDRGVVSVSGEEAEPLLQRLVTNDMHRLAREPALYAGLLSPQGKILSEFFVVKSAGGLLLESDRERAADLVKRLNLYKLRARVEIQDESAAYLVLAAWDSVPAAPEGAIVYRDPRLSALGWRLLVPIAQAAALVASASPADYQAHRIGLGVPEGGKDYAFGDTFPHEANFDQLQGLAFDKGCYIGQEVVSRMTHRANVRKRVVPIEGAAPLPAGADVRAGAATIGKVGSVAGTRGLALLRLDRAAEAEAKGERLTAGDTVVILHKPPWATFDLAPAKPRETA